MAITFGDDRITIDTILDLVRFGAAMGGLANISLEQAIQDEKKNILIAAKRPLRENLLAALEEREQAGKFMFLIENSALLRSQVGKNISLEIQKKLTLSDFSFPAWLLNKTKVDIYQVLRASLNNDFFFITVVRIILESSTIFPHLLETALLATGLYAEVLGERAAPAGLNTIFMAAFLHDYSLISLANWSEKDIFPSDGHDIESAALLSGKKLPEGVSRIIRDSNKLNERYRDMEKGANDRNWFADTEELGAAILNITEYFLYCKRTGKVAEISESAADNEMAEIMYHLGLQTQHGAFPFPLLKVFQRHYEKYRRFFEYGQKIATIEQSCKFEKYALAYPKPRATQVLCRDHHLDCVWRQHSNRITVVQSVNKVVTRYGIILTPGEYDKCRLSDELPDPPFEV